MKEEIVSYEVNLKYTSGSINPIDVNEKFLNDVGIIDNDKNKLNRGMLRIGSLGTNIIISNTSQDELKVHPTSLFAESNSKERLILIIRKIKDLFSDTTILNVNFAIDYHLIDDTFPQSIFKSLVTSDLDLEVIQLKKEDVTLTMYSCGNNKIHIKTTSQKFLRKQFSDLDFEQDFQITKIEEVYNNFKKKDLKL